MSFLYTFVILLAAAIVAVPLAKRFGFGSVPGARIAPALPERFAQRPAIGRAGDERLKNRLARLW